MYIHTRIGEVAVKSVILYSSRMYCAAWSLGAPLISPENAVDAQLEFWGGEIDNDHRPAKNLPSLWVERNRLVVLCCT